MKFRRSHGQACVKAEFHENKGFLVSGILVNRGIVFLLPGGPKGNRFSILIHQLVLTRARGDFTRGLVHNGVFTACGVVQTL